VYQELDEADFCVPEEGHPDEIMLPDIPANNTKTQAKPPTNAPAHVQQHTRASSTGPIARPPHTPNQAQSKPVQQASAQVVQNNRAQSSGPQAAAAPQPEPVAFFSAKALSQLPESNLQGQSNGGLPPLQAQQLFNPKAESPSIRKTPGIDHTSSRPVARNGQHVPPSSSQAGTSTSTANSSSFTPVRPSAGGPSAARGNLTNPALDQTRRIGAPTAPGSPLSNRGSFRQPTMKRPPPGDSNVRPALADMPTNAGAIPSAAAQADGLETKRQRMT
jgi:DNA repair and recombination protein RAD52